MVSPKTLTIKETVGALITRLVGAPPDKAVADICAEYLLKYLTRDGDNRLVDNQTASEHPNMRDARALALENALLRAQLETPRHFMEETHGVQPSMAPHAKDFDKYSPSVSGSSVYDDAREEFEVERVDQGRLKAPGK
jgi:hypothetical protein